jgi:hypothetical protein
MDFNIDLSIARRCYFSDEYELGVCPECGAATVINECSVLMSVNTDKGQGQFVSNITGTHFCTTCPVSVFDIESLNQLAVSAYEGAESVKFFLAGIVDFDAIPDENIDIELGTTDNPLPLVKFLPNLIPRQSHKSEDLPGRNDPCLCGSGKKFKKCCGRE